jgi:hypothetical protein
MKEKTVKTLYEADDGRVFASRVECKKYEASHQLVAYLRSILPVDKPVTLDELSDALRSDLPGLKAAIKRPRAPRGSRKARAAGAPKDDGSRSRGQYSWRNSSQL